TNRAPAPLRRPGTFRGSPATAVRLVRVAPGPVRTRSFTVERRSSCFPPCSAPPPPDPPLHPGSRAARRPHRPRPHGRLRRRRVVNHRRLRRRRRPRSMGAREADTDWLDFFRWCVYTHQVGGKKQRMRTRAKLSSQERRAAIIQAVRRVFAEKGFHGTTIRALAQAAGVSEALLFKHFPNKEALFSAMQLSCVSQEDVERRERLLSLEPSASTGVMMVHFMVSRIIGRCTSPDDDQRIHHRLMLRSLAENGEFARHILQQKAAGWIEKFEEGMKVAAAAGEAHPGPVQPRLGGWFVHHLAVMTMTYLLPDNPAVDYGVPREKLVEQIVWFTLRGMGLKEEAIRRHYNPKALALFAD